MAIAVLQKILIVGHKSQQEALLDRLQREGFVHVCSAAQSALQQEFAGLQDSPAGQSKAELMRARLADCVEFLKPHVPAPASLRERFTPRPALDQQQFDQALEQANAQQLLGSAQQLRERLSQIDAAAEKLQQRISALEPWQSLDAPVEGLRASARSVLAAGLVPNNRGLEELQAELTAAGVAAEWVNCTDDLHYVLIAYAQASLELARQALHKIDFEPCNFEGLTGTPGQIIAEAQDQLQQLSRDRRDTLSRACELAQQVQVFGILHDHFQNLAKRDQLIAQGLATGSSFFLEGWIRSIDWERLESLVGEFGACMVQKVEPAEGEEAPVDLQNAKPVRPFEVITSLYGMPGKKDVDPTPFLAPFFVIFFGLCLTDAGYGLTLLIGSLIALKLLGKGAAKLLGVLAIGGAAAIVLGAITNGYFGDAPKHLGWPWLISLRDYLGQFGFNPMKEPMKFFILAVGLGYFQLMSGLVIALIHNLRQKDFSAALGDQVTWFLLLNSIVVIALAKAGMLPTWPVPVCLVFVLAAAAGIVLGSQREGGLGERLGMGFYNLFSAIFYLGDVLSYLRLMALGMVTAGIAMAVNVIAGIAWQIPVLGILLAGVVLVVGHVVNLLLSTLSAFVHTLRLQYVEFFPKFFVGGGAEFQPFARVWKYTQVESETTQQKVRS